MLRWAVFIALACCPLAGCSQSQYLVVEPEPFARTVGLEHTFIARPPLDYQLFTENGRLRVRAVNNTDSPIKILGEESWLVDPTGQSHSLRNQSIPAGSFVAWTMPPRRPRVGGAGIGVGVGGGSDGAFGGIGVGRHWHDSEPYMGTDDPPYYDWTTGDVRLHLAIERAGERHDQEFVFRRQKLP